MPEAKWHVYEPIHRDMAWHGAQMAFGEPVNPVYDFRKADVVLSLDADFLQCGPGNLRYAADFMDRRAGADRREKDAADGPDEPAVRGRNGRQLHRRQGRPSAGPAAERDRRAGPGGGHEARR